MPYYKFEDKDILRNTLKAHPRYVFDIISGSIYLNSLSAISGAHNNNVTMVPTGHLSLYELNIDRKSSDHTYDPDTGGGVKALIYPFTTKDGSLNSMGTVTDATFNTSYEYGDIITGSYPMSASITRERFASGAGTSKPHVTALKNVLNHYTYLSEHYAFSSSHGDKNSQESNLISIPSIFFDSGIKPGSVNLEFYISGSRVAQLTDKNKNGELIQTDGDSYAQTNGSDSVAGVVLYNEGFVLLTGSWNLTPASYNFTYATRQARWCDFGAGANDSGDSNLAPSASFRMEFKGTNEVTTLDMHMIAPKGLLNHSSNPTYRLYNSSSVLPIYTYNSSSYSENSDIPIKNTISGSICNHSSSFKKQTFISTIGIFDDQKKLIGTVKLATPVKKTENRAFTFKVKLDI
tara:strand:- start:9443 stop:10657 length:1215 start_codon:yes stop_codon:yes gene_type:complete